MPVSSSKAISRRPAFTLVELLVAVGVIGILAALLVPVVNKIRESARRSTDLSNLRQLTAACLVYAHDNDGLFPAGRISSMPDDYTWLSYRNCWAPLLGISTALNSINSCVSVRDIDPDSDDFGKTADEYGSPEDTRVGWIYWAGRDDLNAGGKLQYRSPRRTGQHLTPGSQTLWTCMSWDSAGTSGPSVCPHIGGAGAMYPLGVPLKPPPDGLGIALDDGSASFVAWSDTIIISQANGFKLYYQP